MSSNSDEYVVISDDSNHSDSNSGTNNEGMIFNNILPRKLKNSPTFLIHSAQPAKINKFKRRRSVYSYSEDKSNVAKKLLKDLFEDSKFMEGFNPAIPRQQKNKLRNYSSGTGSWNFNPVDEPDICDCLDLSCPGCFFKCPKCKSTKCGTHCREKRRWIYEHVVYDGTCDAKVNPLLE